MAKNLDDAIEAVLYLASQLEGLRAASTPLERIPVEQPFALAFPGSGGWTLETEGSWQGLHTIILLVSKVRKDLPRDLEVIVPFGERVKSLFLSGMNLTLPDRNGVATIAQITSLTYDFGPIAWGDGVPRFGWSFEIGVKIRNT